MRSSANLGVLLFCNVLLIGCGGASAKRADSGQASSDGDRVDSGQASDGAGEAAEAGTALLRIDSEQADFGTVDVGTSRTSEFTITNIGSGSSGAITVEVNGSEFALDYSDCMVLGPSEKCSVWVAFAPTSWCGSEGSLVVGTALGGSVRAKLTGVGIISGHTPLYPPSIDFRDVPLGATALASVVLGPILSCYGIADIVFTVSGMDFAVDQSTTTCADSLAVGASCMIGVAFTPRGLGYVSGTLTLSQGGVTAAVPLSGQGVAPSTEVDAAVAVPDADEADGTDAEPDSQ